jgi:hypothetical protein
MATEIADGEGTSADGRRPMKDRECSQTIAGKGRITGLPRLAPTSVRVSARLADRLAEFFNEAMDLDPFAISALFGCRADCNQAFANHPTIQVGKEVDQVWSVGFVGLLNGLLAPTGNLLATLHEVGEGGLEREIVGFRAVPVSQCWPCPSPYDGPQP